MFYCETCKTHDRLLCRCDRIDGLNDGDLAEAGPIRYRVEHRQTQSEIVTRYRELEALPMDEEDRTVYLRMWATSIVAGKMLSFGGGRDEHLKEAVKVCEAADVLATYVMTGTADATKAMIGLAEQPSITHS